MSHIIAASLHTAVNVVAAVYFSVLIISTISMRDSNFLRLGEGRKEVFFFLFFSPYSCELQHWEGIHFVILSKTLSSQGAEKGSSGGPEATSLIVANNQTDTFRFSNCWKNPSSLTLHLNFTSRSFSWCGHPRRNRLQIHVHCSCRTSKQPMCVGQLIKK